MASLSGLLDELGRVVGPKRAQSISSALGAVKGSPPPEVHAFYLDTTQADVVTVYVCVNSSLSLVQLSRSGDYQFHSVPLRRLRRITEQFAGGVLTVVVEYDAEPTQFFATATGSGERSQLEGMLRYPGWVLSAPASSAKKLALFSTLLRARAL